MTKYGYIRVSSKDQKPERQVEALLNYGIEKENIFTDYMSGKYPVHGLSPNLSPSNNTRPCIKSC